MKKFLFLLILIVSFTVMFVDIIGGESVETYSKAESGEYREAFNNKTNMEIARAVTQMAETERVAVVGNKEQILVGILLKPGVGDRNKLRKNIENAVKEEYKKAKIIIEIETEKTQEIFDLAETLDKGASGKSTDKKFQNLVEK